MMKAMEGKRIGEYLVIEKAGQGSYTVVWKGIHVIKGNYVAIKEIDLRLLNKRLKQCLDCELTFLNSVVHPNIIRLHQTIQVGDRLFLILEYCSGGDLADYIKRCGRVHEHVVKRFMQQLGAGLGVLHAYHVVHRDLKPENILLSTNDSSAVLKIADFGLSSTLSPDAKVEVVCGTPSYMAPEVLQFQKYDMKADMWSVGAILFELLNGYAPFNGRSNCQLLRSIKLSTALPFQDMILSDLHPDCIDVCERLLCQNPVNRLSARELIKHRFLL